MDSASRRYPSFSSTLLDQMYRSIDNDDHKQRQPTQSQSIHSKFRPCFEDDACFIHNKPLTGRKSAADDLQMRCAAATQSFCTPGVLIKPKPIPIPIRRGCVDDEEIIKLQRKQTKPKDEGKTRLKALKILYGDLKKAKQPVSPGGRLATFLNSLFFPNNNNNNNKKKKPTTDNAGLGRKSKSANASTCSSASPVSRSRVSSNIPSSTPNLSKRSVRFYQPSLHQHQTNYLNKLNLIDTHKNRQHISEAARNLLKNYQKKVEFDSTRNINVFENQTDDDDDDDDARSDSSSDLFELENLSASRYREELPVYETTRLDTNPLFM